MRAGAFSNETLSPDQPDFRCSSGNRVSGMNSDAAVLGDRACAGDAMTELRNVSEMLKADQTGDLFARIGSFLAMHRLSPEPAHYSFAYGVLSEPEGPLAEAVVSLTDGGIRLTQHDIEGLGGQAVAGSPTDLVATLRHDMVDTQSDPAPVETLLAKTQLQVDGFVDTMRTMHAQTTGFGRDLAASAEAMRVAGPAAGIEEIARLAGTMLERVRHAEGQLAEATQEADTLRAALDEARGCARRDPLTELANRLAFDEAFATLSADAPAAVAICDVDHFKRVNDDFGHGVGDRILVAIARLLAENCEGHLVARYGGEEFALLFRDTDAATAAALIDEARVAVATKRFRSRDTGALIGNVTFSAGIADVSGSTREAAMRRADTALYEAKAMGRNQILLARTSGL